MTDITITEVHVPSLADFARMADTPWRGSYKLGSQRVPESERDAGPGRTAAEFEAFHAECRARVRARWLEGER